MVGSERQSFGVEVIDGQIAVGMNNDWPRTGFDGRGVNAVAESLLNITV